MFIGHFGVGLAAKPVAKRISLGTLFLASQFVDLLWPSLLLLGLETVTIVPGSTKLTPLEFTHYPISHSLLGVVIWSALFAVVYFAIRRASFSAFVCGALVVSHWVLDALVHKPDLLLYPGSTVKIGMGLWNHPAPAIALETGIFALGVYLYVRTTRATDGIGAIAFWSLIGFLLLMHGGNIFGPPPPSVGAVAWVSQAQWLLVLWGYWIDRHREARVL